MGSFPVRLFDKLNSIINGSWAWGRDGWSVLRFKNYWNRNIASPFLCGMLRNTGNNNRIKVVEMESTYNIIMNKDGNAVGVVFISFVN